MTDKYDDLRLAIKAIEDNIIKVVEIANEYKIPIRGHRKTMLACQGIKDSINYYIESGKPYNPVNINDMDNVYTISEAEQIIRKRFELCDHLEIKPDDNVIRVSNIQTFHNIDIDWFRKRNIDMSIAGLHGGLEILFFIREGRA